MRIGARRAEDDFEINVISLIDVMLTLLMFFVVTATFESRSMMKVVLPQASSTPQQQKEEGLTILIDKDGHFFVNANEVLNPGVDTIKAAVERVAGTDREKPVTLRADGRTPHQSVITAMDALGQLGFSRLTIATTPTPATKK